MVISLAKGYSYARSLSSVVQLAGFLDQLGVMLYIFPWITNVTDRQTDRQDYYVAIPRYTL